MIFKYRYKFIIMDFLKDLLELNNVVYLTKLAEKQGLEEDEKEIFIQKYNKISNR